VETVHEIILEPGFGFTLVEYNLFDLPFP